MDDTLHLTFEKPITVGTAVYESLTLTQPLVEHLLAAADFTGLRSVLKLIELVGKVPPQVLNKMTQRDLARCADFLDGFNKLPEKASTSST
jgi:hypothetical protein